MEKKKQNQNQKTTGLEFKASLRSLAQRAKCATYWGVHTSVSGVS